MNKFIFLVIILGIAVLAAIIGLIFIGAPFGFSSPIQNQIRTNNSGIPAQISADAGGEQISDEAEVSVGVKSRQLGVNEEKNIFEVSFNTHSVDLNYDFAKISTLKDDLGNVYEAETWSGQSSGHHLSGELIFPKINVAAKSVQLVIDNINGVKRVFNWQLK